VGARLPVRGEQLSGVVTPVVRRRIGRGAAVLTIVLAAAWYGDAGSAIPLDGWGEPAGEPMLQPPSVALRLVERDLWPYGGLPRDARIAEFTPYVHNTTVEGDPRRVISASGYNLTFVRGDAIQPADEIRAQVGTETIRRCLDGGTLASPYEERKTEPSCHHYRITMPVHVTSVRRHWRPWPVRAMTRRLDAWFAPQFQAPESIEEGCSKRDLGAFRRAVAAATIPFAPKGYVDIPALWERAVKSAMDGHGLLARWNPPYPSVRFAAVQSGYRTLTEGEISEAIVLDVPVFPNWSRLVLVRSPRPIDKLLVGALETTNDEPVCPPVRIAEAASPPAALPDWDTLQRIVQARAEDEIRWLAAFRGTTLGSRVVATDHHAGATSTIDVETWIDRAHWRGRFTVDEHVPELRDAEFTRL
jgi:hypothetical protein